MSLCITSLSAPLLTLTLVLSLLLLTTTTTTTTTSTTNIPKIPGIDSKAAAEHLKILSPDTPPMTSSGSVGDEHLYLLPSLSHSSTYEVRVSWLATSPVVFDMRFLNMKELQAILKQKARDKSEKDAHAMPDIESLKRRMEEAKNAKKKKTSKSKDSDKKKVREETVPDAEEGGGGEGEGGAGEEKGGERDREPKTPITHSRSLLNADKLPFTTNHQGKVVLDMDGSGTSTSTSTVLLLTILEEGAQPSPILLKNNKKNKKISTRGIGLIAAYQIIVEQTYYGLTRPTWIMIGVGTTALVVALCIAFPMSRWMVRDGRDRGVRDAKTQ